MRALNFAKKNALEIARDPVLYIFCVAFPVLMLILFSVISSFTGDAVATFRLKSLMPGIMVFSLSFIMLLLSLEVSKDRSTAFILRLYSSPMRTSDFIIGYALPAVVVGIAQGAVCLLSGYVVSLITGEEYLSFGAAALLEVNSIPILLINVFIGIGIGAALNDKAAPGVTSVFITASGVLGGAWMPLDTMGGFETFCRFLPFYPAVYIGRIISGASHTITDFSEGAPAFIPYEFDDKAVWAVVAIGVYLILSVAFALISFKAKMKSDKR